jgi:sterol desaturase/sphingolipid hydroxylase (fatty acid hydroxylase superfamily)
MALYTIGQMARRLAQVLLFPAYLAFAVVAGELLSVPRLPEIVVIMAVTAGCALLLVVAQLLLPYERGWNRSHGDLITDALHAAGSNLVALPFGVLVMAWPAAAWWPRAWPVLAQLPLAVVVADLVGYWCHRWLHRGLWPVHAIHHSAARLYWLNGARVHPIEASLDVFASLAPLVLLGAPPRLLTTFMLFAGAYRMMQHANLDVRLGPLNWVFSGPELHRWHHARQRRQADANYSNISILWDVVFGTRALPPGDPPRDVGIEAPADFPMAWGKALLAPFARRYWRS